MINLSERRLLIILKSVLSGSKIDKFIFQNMNDDDWKTVIDLSFNQGVYAVIFEGLELMPDNCHPSIDILTEWFGQVHYLELRYVYYLNRVIKLAKFFKRQGIKMVLLKGYGLSLFYPTPEHRPTGDIDSYHLGYGEFADQMIKNNMGIEVKQNEEKHSVYAFEGIHVENHATIINGIEHKSLNVVEKFFETELRDNSEYDEVSGCYLPSALFNAVYLPLHIGGHFVYNGATIRQVVDYALMVKQQHTLIDWNKVKELANLGGYFRFLCCLNGICIDYLGIKSSLFPEWDYDNNLKDKVLNDILKQQIIITTSIFGKVKRYFDKRWKFELVFENDNFIEGFFLHIRSWLIWKWGIGRKSVWN